MPSGVVRLRMARKDHPMPREGHEQKDISGLRGTDHRQIKVDPLAGTARAPIKARPFKRYPDTGVPPPAEVPHNGGREGKKKQSKHERGAYLKS